MARNKTRVQHISISDLFSLNQVCIFEEEPLRSNEIFILDTEQTYFWKKLKLIEYILFVSQKYFNTIFGYF